MFDKIGKNWGKGVKLGHTPRQFWAL